MPESSARSGDGSSPKRANGMKSRKKDRVYILVFLAVKFKPYDGLKLGLP